MTLDITGVPTGEGAALTAVKQAMARAAAEPSLARVKWLATDDGRPAVPPGVALAARSPPDARAEA